ncbi:MAG: hypothetical protein HOB84_15870 [Candidatus Marinimicrobia bacterium]|nr:hypothetical protein [Candidatus Neomarinimicrobiota bacterium]MBT4360491.1 hypothetical protein [Candidatus Neomarinimicrobiota bacterium]MBT4716244.1 hypothetical protein [Candidatus Neomarinimicrobiota bacterium]MBT4945294.1 hypothetical protein [Candidatus Neomarinimicrobiota bacterium]MBT5269208.1 hypothetical protein [Candidatus Neomarinimicrobiota bacterium]
MGDIDFANPDSRMTYLKDNLSHLMNGIDSNYGQVLMDELMRRMETTVSEFNDEVKAMLGQLQGIKPTPRDNILTSAPRPEPQAPSTPKAAPAAPAPPPPTTDLKPAPAVEEPQSAPELPQFSEDLDEPIVFKEDSESSGSINEVEIEVDLEGEELSDFEKKLRSLGK